MIGDEPNAIDLFRLSEGLGEGEVVDVPAEFSTTIPRDCLLSEFGIELRQIGRGRAHATMTVAKRHLNQRGIAQAGAVVALADATAGWASYSALEHGRFTTLNLDMKLLRAARDGDRLVATASPIHLGRSTQVLDVVVTHSETDKAIARFTCTQMVLGPAK